MTDFPVRHFADEAAVAHVGEGLPTRTLPKAEWTHEAHLATPIYLLLKHPESDLDTAFPGLLRAYNKGVGSVNDDTQGYHDTITRSYLHGVRLFLCKADQAAPIHELVNDLIHSPMGQRDWTLRFWSKERLMSVEARRAFVEPDVAALP
ncbi:MAG: hypothetical protein LH610_03265 [Sphingomonas bacterium]|nr:hypothetical protein [Sphingomonas bacterium]